MKRMKKNTLFVANKLEFYRCCKGLSISDLSSLSGVSELTLKAIEESHFNCSIQCALRISIVLEVPVDNLFNLSISS